MGSSHLYGRDFYRTFAGGSGASAEVVVPLVLDLVRPVSVVDVGCGVGLWLAECKRRGVQDVLGVDFGEVPRQDIRLDDGEFTSHDLSEPLALGRRFDLAMCLEVAEHLPDAHSDRLVDDLTALAPVVLFSAAIPGQGGVGHVNEQWPEYWAERFAARSFAAVDAIRPRIWAEPRVDFWYAQNVLVFAAAEVLASNERLRVAADRTEPALARVHPTLHLASIEAAGHPWRSLTARAVETIRRVPSQVRAARRAGGPGGAP